MATTIIYPTRHKILNVLFPLVVSTLLTACAGLDQKGQRPGIYDVQLDAECCDNIAITPKSEVVMPERGSTSSASQPSGRPGQRGTFNQGGRLPESGTGRVGASADGASAALVGKGLPTDKLELNYEQAELRVVVEDLAEILGINLLISMPVEGTVTFKTNPLSSLTRQDIWPLLRLLLANAGLNLDRHEDFFEVVAGSGGLDEIAMPGAVGRSQSSVVTQVTPLKFVDAAIAIDLLAPLLDGEGGRATTANTINMLAITASPEQLANINQLLRLVDVDPFQHRGIRLFYLQNADAELVATELTSILEMIEGHEGTYQVQGLKRINGLLVVSPPQRGFRAVERWVRILDETGSAQGEQMFVYRMKSLNAVTMAETLNDVFSQDEAKAVQTDTAAQTSDSPSSVSRQDSSRVPGKDKVAEKSAASKIVDALKASTQRNQSFVASDGVSANLKLVIVADEETNSLLVRATPRDYQQLLATLSLLDKPPLEVVISVIIAQVTLNDSTDFGIDWESIFDKTTLPSTLTANSFVGTGFGTTEALTKSDGSAVGLVVSSTSSGGDLKAVLNALASTNKVNVLSRPTILVKNNQEASIKVGSQQPVITAQKSATDTGTTPVVSNDISYRDTGIELTVKPQINDEGIIQLEIDQSLSSIGQNSAVPGLPSFDNQQINTVAVVADRSVIMLGGLIESTTTDKDDYVPFLGSIPVVGAAFGSTNLSTVRRELVLMMVPEIIDPKGGETFYKAFRKRVKHAASVLESSFSDDQPWKPMSIPEKIERILVPNR